MKKILILNYEFPPLGGGAANATEYMCKEFSKRKDIEIDLITSSVGEFRKEQFSDNITVHFLDIGKNPENLHYQTNKDLLKYSWKAYFYIKKILKKAKEENNQYDVIHAFFGIPCGFLAMKLSKKFNIPYIVSLRGSDVPFYNKRFENLDKFVFKKLSKKIWKNSKYTIANSKGLRDLALESAPFQQIGIIENGVNTQEFQDVPKQKQEIFTILYVGRLIERKGVDILLEGFQQFSEGKNNVQLWIVGDGNQAEYLQKTSEKIEIKNIVKFFGKKNHDELPKIYRKSDVYILPSKNEGMSNALLEAIASELPVIVSDTGGTSELVTDNGMILSEITGEEISKALEKIYSDITLQKKMSENSSRLSKTLSWKNMANQYFKLY